MPFTKFATFDQAEILDIKGSRTRQHTASLDKLADFENYRTDDGYLYVRIRAISSRTNRNHDGWPSVELAGSPSLFEHHHGAGGFTVEASQGNQEYGFATFIGKPIFVDHHNSNPKKARGVIKDAKFRVLDKESARKDSYWGGHDVDSEHLPASEVELLLEVDANTFPRLAQAIVSGDLDGFSMGCDVDYSKCSHCGHIAHAPDEYCSHIMMKGAHHDFKTAEGKRVSRKSYENCYGIKFFEISAVFDPADETALAREVRAAVYKEGIATGIQPTPEGDLGYGVKPDPLRDPSEIDIENHALQLQQLYNYDPETALALAQERHNKQNPLPGHGEGESYAPKRMDYMESDPHGMPRAPQGMEGFPPPVRPDRPFTPFGEAAEEALNEAYPKRPVMNDPMYSSVKTAENPLPQEMHTRAPDEIDTLRQEQLCPICGNDMHDETCEVCGYVSPPKEFDNPDLDKATQIRDRMKQEEEQQASGMQPPTQPGEQLGQPQDGPGGGPLTSQMPRKAPPTANVKSEMRWTPKVHPKTAARINQVERPVVPSPRPVSDEPANAVVIKDQTVPVTAAMRTARELMANAQRNHGELMNTRTADGPTPPGDTSPTLRTDVTGVGGVMDASNEEASKTNNQHGQNDHDSFAQVDVTGKGTTGVSDVSADKTESLPTAGRDSDDSGFNKDKSIEEIHTKTFGDSDGGHSGVTDPVTSEPFPRSEDGVKASGRRQAYEDGPLETLDQQGGSNDLVGGGSAVKGVQPVAEQFGDRVNLLEHKTSPSNNSGPTTTWTGTDGNGVLRQQDPVTRDSQEWGGVKVPDVQLHTTGRVSIAALRLAELEHELGLISREERWNRMADLDTQDHQAVLAQLETLTKVKTAGLKQLAQHRQASATRLPKAFGKSTAAPNGFERIASGSEVRERTPLSDEQLDSGLFLK